MKVYKTCNCKGKTGTKERKPDFTGIFEAESRKNYTETQYIYLRNKIICSCRCIGLLYMGLPEQEDVLLHWYLVNIFLVTETRRPAKFGLTVSWLA
jgi:hypothetical protein